ncbi:hypothetical protein MCOR27_009312 [Pyricularia oryzae]|uniref:Ribosomal protein S6 n=5 Tax=Pyricularia TaxID=48558 RepID=A0ABQ8N3B8_PYRGI|nr:30S ribosomal protein S6 [Pyricularia oryzae 70-15]ELQ35599.1 37S ribosomal protein Mrp17 [Pyricularia oryzae Y34]KAH8843701.1 hypothetical protein MCOR01_004491 [Pyricularia oryzae]KAI6290028.1 hypothetical protein MCOR33_011575 [Pyricularia grisea]EHA50562.1 30S ribosomal protein S6 [Pyricularia oryzae 70-15]KAH9431174.1 hypothetical protein MCOR02_008479 [Pyricularia oryzae]
MLYEMIAIIRPGKIHEVKEIMQTAGSTILRSGGVIRDMANWGVFMLPRATTYAQARYKKGHYVVMRYDAGVKAQETVSMALRLEPRVIRATSVKLGGGKLERMAKLNKVPWNTLISQQEQEGILSGKV